MQKDLIEVLDSVSGNNLESLAIDNVILENGLYITAKKDNTSYRFDLDSIYVVQNRKVDRDDIRYTKYCKLDYYSKYINSNKSVANKNISSCTYFSLYVKKETFEALIDSNDYKIVDDYFYQLSNMSESLKKKDRLKFAIYDDLITNGLLKGYICPVEQIEKHRDWIKEHLSELKEEVAKLGKGEYVKVFFEADDKEYIREYLRYAIPNLFINNKYNIQVNDKIMGIPVPFYNVNLKKPYKFNHTRPLSTPYLVDQEFNTKIYNAYKYLLASSRAPFLFVNTENEKCKTSDGTVSGSGIFFKSTNTTKGLVIDDWDIVTCTSDDEKYCIQEFIPDEFNTYKDKESGEIKTDILYGENYYVSDNDNHKEIDEEGNICRVQDTRLKLVKLIDRVFFNNKLIYCFFIDGAAIKEECKGQPYYIRKNINKYRGVLSDWLLKNTINVPKELFCNLALQAINKNLIDNSIKAIKQINVLMSLMSVWEGDSFMHKTSKEIADSLFNKMELQIRDVNSNVQLENHNEYAFALGQLAYYVGNLSKAKTSYCQKRILKERTSKGILTAINEIYSSGKFLKAIKLKSRFMSLYNLVSQYYNNNQNETLDKLIYMQGYAYGFGNVMFYKSTAESVE